MLINSSGLKLIHCKMYYNPETDRALRTIEDLAEENRKIIMKLNPKAPLKIVWGSNRGRWLDTPPSK